MPKVQRIQQHSLRHSPHPSDRETQEHPQVPVCWRIPPEISARLSLETAALSLHTYENISTRGHPRVLPSSSSTEDAQFALILLQLLRGTLERSFIDLVFTIFCFSLKIPIWIEIICLRSEVRNIILVSLRVSGVLHFYKVVCFSSCLFTDLVSFVTLVCLKAAVWKTK